MAAKYKDTTLEDVRKLLKAAEKANSGGTTAKQDKVSSQIKNKKTRLAASGADYSKVEDSRNAVEKFFNVKEDQNFLFDIFEVLGRPQQAVFGAVDALINDEDIGKAALEHLKGNEETNGKKILTDLGMSDREGKLDLSDVLGFVGDVMLDPVDLALIPVTAGGSVVASAAGNVADAGRVASKAVKAVDTAKDVANAVDAASDVAKGTKWTTTSLSNLLFKGAGKAVKGGVRATDNVLEAALKKADELAGITYKTPDAISAANLGKKLADGVPTNQIGKFEAYKDIKDTVGRLFNKSANISKETADAIRKTDTDTILSVNELGEIRNKLDNTVKTAAEKYAKSKGITNADEIAEIANKMDKDVANLMEFRNINRATTVGGLIDEGINGVLSYRAIGDEGINALKDVADDINKANRGVSLTVDVVGDDVVLNKSWGDLTRLSSKDLDKLATKYDENYIKELKSLNLDKSKLDKEFVKKGTYSEEAEAALKALDKEYSSNPILKKLYEDTSNTFNEANKVVNKNFGTKLPTKNNAGYVRHAYNKENFDKYKSLGLKGNTGVVFRGNTAILGDRKYNMSTIEANEMFKDTILKNLDSLDEKEAAFAKEIAEGGLFKEGLGASLDSYLENIPTLAKNSNNIDNVLVKSSFGNWEELQDIEKALKKATDPTEIAELEAKRVEKLNNGTMKILTNRDPKVPRGYTRLDKKDVRKLSDKMRRLGDELGNDNLKKYSDVVKGFGDDIALNSDVLRLMEINTNTKDVNQFVRMYDSALNFFKKNKVLSPTFQMNNIVGNSSNMFLAGISPAKQGVLIPEAANILSKKDDVLKKVAQNIKLTDDEQEVFDIWRKFMDAGFGNPRGISSAQLADMPESIRKYFIEGKKPQGTEWIKDGLPYLNMLMNEQADTTFRLATFLEGSRNKKFLDKLGVADAGEAVRKVLFDPDDLTDFEKNVMKRVMPFYTFTKKNLAFQIDNLSKNGSQYHKLFKAQDKLLEAATGGNDENIEDWLRNNMYIPIPKLNEDGSYSVIRATLPFGNLIETINDPLSTLVSSTTPAIKLPYELLTNKNSFTGADLESFPGQMSKNIPGITKKAEHFIGSTTGLDVPIKNAVRAYNGIADTMNSGGTFFEGLGAGAENVLTMENNINTDKLNRMYEELDELENLMKQYEQKGYQFSTMNELKKANTNSKLDNALARINKYYNRNVTDYGTAGKLTNEQLYGMYGIK